MLNEREASMRWREAGIRLNSSVPIEGDHQAHYLPQGVCDE
jgi:hypothetical protein